MNTAISIERTTAVYELASSKSAFFAKNPFNNTEANSTHFRRYADLSASKINVCLKHAITFTLTLLLISILKFEAIGQTNVNVGSGTATSATTNPVNNNIAAAPRYWHFQYIYTPAELTAGGWTAGAGYVITQLGWKYKTNTAPQTLNDYTIRMGHTTSDYNTTVPLASLTTVKNAFSYTTPTAPADPTYDMIPLDANFTWDGTSSICIDICWTSSATTTRPTMYMFSGGVRAISTSGSTTAQCSNFTMGSTSCCTVKAQARLVFTSGAACTAPNTQASNINTTPAATTSSINWNNGNGGGRVVYINTTNSFTAPTDGSNPTANLAYSGGQQCVYNGAGSGPITVTGLSSSTTYYVRVYEYCTPTRNYITSTTTLNPNSFTTTIPCSAPGTQVSSVTAIPTSTTASINWTNGNGGGRVVYINTINSFTAPTNGINPTANLSYTSGQQCVFNGTGSGPITVTGLSAATTYYVRVYEYCSPDRNYNTNTATNNPNSFTTTVSYCAPSIAAPCAANYDMIDAVQFGAGGSVYNGPSTGCTAGGYSDQTSVTINFTQGTTYPFSITTFAVFNNSSDNCAIWIDFNDDGDFVDAGEFLTNVTASANIFSGNITVPAGAPTGNHRMRIRGAYSTAFVIGNTSCEGQTYGEAQDYTVNIVAAGCSAPGIQASSITATPSTNSAIINWSNGDGAGRAVYVNTINSFTAPASGSNPTANLTYTSGQHCVFNGVGGGAITISGLSAATTYYVRVYEYCSPDRNYNTSSATNNPNNFTTTGGSCSPPNGTAGFSFSGVNPVATTVNATYTNGGNAASGYVLLRSTSTTAPMAPASGTAVPAAGSSVNWGGAYTVVNATTTLGSAVAFSSTGLNCNTQYYYWIVAYQNTSGPCWFTPSHTGNSQTTQGAPNLPSTPTGNVTPCSGVANNYTITAVPGATSYDWKLEQSLANVGPVNTAGTTASLTFTSSGWLTVQANNSCGSSGYLTSISRLGVSVTPASVFNFPDGTTVNVGCQLNFSLNTPYPSSVGSSINGTVVYSSSNGTGYVIPSNNLGGTGLTATYNGCNTTTNLTITTNGYITSNGTLNTGNQTICEGVSPNSITFSSAPTLSIGSPQYQWYFKSGAGSCPAKFDATTGWTLITGATNNSYTPGTGVNDALTTGGSQLVRTYACRVLPGTSACSQWATNCRQITVNPSPSAPSITVSESSGTANDGQICNGASVTLSGPAGATTYAWSNGGGSSQTSNSFSPTTNTTYSLTVTNASNCSASADYTVTVTACGVNTWLGGSTQWSDASNWSSGYVPNDCAHDVLIPATPANGSVFPLIGLSSFTVGDLTVQSGASITINNTQSLNICGDLNGGSGTAGTIGGNSSNGIILIGNTAQQITGTLNANIIRFNNTSMGGVDVLGTLNVTTAFIMQDGDVNANVGTIRLKSDATTTAYLDNFTSPTAGNYFGNMTAERYIANTADGYRDISSPVNTTVADLSDDMSIFGQDAVNCWYAYSPYPNVQVYDESANDNLSTPTGNFFTGWLSRTGTGNNMSAMRGFAIRTYAGAPYTIDLSGTPYNGLQSIGISRNTTATTSADGWNFVGNPYASPIDWDLVTKTGIDASYYVYSTTGEYTGNWSAYNGVVGVNLASDKIASMQGFFIRKSSPGTGTFSLDNTARAADASTAFYKANAVQPDEIRLQLTGSGNTDEIVAYTDGNASWGFDAAQDAEKIPAGSTVYMSFKQLGTEYAINVIDEVTETTELPLVLWVTDTGTYTFEATQLNLTGLTAFLKDAEQNTLTNLSTTIPSLQLNGQQVYEGRYSIVFEAVEQPSGIANVKGNGIKIYSHNNIAVVERNNDKPATITISNTLGQTIREVSTESKRTEITLDNVNPWYVIVKVKEANATQTGKVLIK